MGTAIQHYEGMNTAITQFRDPEEVLEEAKRAAVALTKVISMKKDPVKFNGEIYLEREDWGTVARFYGCTAKPTETRYVEFGDVHGFEATAVVIDMRTGIEVGRAESLCLDDEDNWGEVPVYKWVDDIGPDGKKVWDPERKRYKGKRVQDGTKAKPLFQLKSMAQTRAEAKALKGLFSWVVVLAGYKPTPAEEMTGNEERYDDRREERKEPVKEPQSASQKQQAQEQAKTGPTILEVAGVIETVKPGKEDAQWLSLKNGVIVWVTSDKFDGDMKPGMFLKFRGFENKRETTSFWTLTGLIELSPVQEGQVENKLAPDAAKVAEEMFPDAKGNKVVQGMVENGTLRPASEVETGKTIGKKRAQRIYTLCSQNKAKNNGLNEQIIKERLLAVLPIPLEHLSDLEVGMYPQFEKWATGEEDWQEWLNTD